jgi:hypothetical protein
MFASTTDKNSMVHPVDVDARTNVVVFRLDSGETAVGHAPTLAQDGVRAAWDSARRELAARPGSVVGLHTEWEPSAADAAFIEATFPEAAVTFNFGRPDPEGWAEALASAEATMRDADHQPNGELLPVLWSASSPRADLLESVPHWPVAAGRLHLALAVVAPTPHGTVGLHHVTHHQLGDQSFDELMAEACENLTVDLRVDGHETDDGLLLSLSGTLVSAMACMPDFYRRLSELTGAQRLVVGVPCPDEVHVAAADSPLAAVVHRTVHESEYPTTELVPSVLGIEGDHVEVLSERE